ncbi:MAG TPA: zinc-binding dehydrogenase [Solirubrobacteraceae bacterium]|jgi:NADPH2:quinone reductase|nr:zinc-binding dehydrogenase [Solirubrobacteraceae bacterium]
MRAAVLRAFGPPQNLVTETLADPAAGPGEVRVQVELVSVTFVETQLRAGRPPHPAMTPELPAILGNGVGGVVVETGDGADPALAGRRVVTTTGGRGGYATQAVVSQELPIAIPDGLELADAVALLADGRTALSLFEAAAVQPGETVLVEAAAGGVGSLLVQLAVAGGAHVVAVAGGTRKLELARGLGARRAVDYGRPGWAAEAGPVDVVFDGVGGAIARAAFDLITRGGRMLSFGMASGGAAGIDAATAAAAGVTLLRPASLTPQRQRALSERALALAAQGDLRPVVGQWHALDRAADAHAAIEARTTIGKTLLVV